jgi:hypothetical protein
MMKRVRRIAVLTVAALALSSCMHTRIDDITPSIETLKLLREQGAAPIAVGVFSAEGKALARSINIRGSTMSAPKGGDFAQFLRLTFESELRAAGKLDPAATTTISARLIESRASENMADGGASLGAEISVMRDGAVAFRKPYRIETKWKSEFIGALAIPEAFRQYNALYALLVRRVFSDPAFVAATKSRQ